MIKTKNLGAEDLNGFMDEGTEFLGELRFKNVFRVDGHVKGKIFSENTLIVGEEGSIEADVDCGIVSIRGTVKGRVCGREKIELLKGSKVFGTLESPKLLIEEGAFFQGDCHMGSASQSVPAPLLMTPRGEPAGRP